MSTDTQTNLDGRSPATLEKDIDRTRREMDNTIDRLGEKLSPRNLLDNVLDAFRGDDSSSTGQNVARSLQNAGVSVRRTVKEHPIPVMLTAAGAIWWLFDYASDDQRSSLGDTGGDEPDAVPAWEDGYRWESSSFGSEKEWTTRAERILDDLRRRTKDSSTSSSEHLRGVAAGTLGVSGYNRSDLGNHRSRGSSSTHPNWNSLRSLDSVASDYESSDDDATVSEKASATWESIKETMADTKRSSRDKLRAISQSITDYATQTGTAAKAWGASAAATASDWSQTARTRSTEAARYAGDRSQVAGQKIKQGTEVATQKVRQTADEYPLAAAAACYGIGLAAGLLLPSTRYEDELMGEASDEVTDTAKAKAEDALEHGKEVAAETASAAMVEAERQGLTPDRIGKKAQEAVSKAAEAGRNAAAEAKQSVDETVSSIGNVAETGKQTAKKEATKASRA